MQNETRSPDAAARSDHHRDHPGQLVQHEAGESDATSLFEPGGWDARYSAAEQVWSGNPNAQLVAEVTGLEPGTALDVGCGEGGDVVWLALHGWQVTGADFSANGIARAARHATEAGVAERVDWWRVDAREFVAGGRTYDLVTTHFLHPPESGMLDVVPRLCEAVAPGGRLLVVGHAPTPEFADRIPPRQRRAMFFAEELLAALPKDFEVLVAEQRPRTITRDGHTMDVADATLVARRRPVATDPS